MLLFVFLFVLINKEVSCHLSALLGHMCSEREILQLRLTRVVGNFPLLHNAAEYENLPPSELRLLGGRLISSGKYYSHIVL